MRVLLPLLLLPVAAMATTPIDICNLCPSMASMPCPTNYVRQCSSVASSSCHDGVAYKSQCVFVPPHPVPIVGPVQVKYMVTHVVYAMPGRSSSLAYATTTAVGSTLTAQDSSSDELVVTVGSGSKEQVIIPSGSFELKTDDTWGTTTTTQTDYTLTMRDGYQKYGESDGVNHDDDEVWFIANPQVIATYTPASYYGPASTTWKFDTNAPAPTLYFLLVGELNGHYSLSQGVKAALDYWGIDPAVDFPEMLKADPAAGADADPDRYVLLGEWPYEPVAHQGDVPSPQTHFVDRKVTDSSDTQKTSSYSVSVKVGASFSFLGLPLARWSVQNVWTWKHSTDQKTSVAGEKSTTLTVGQPTFGYQGPTILRAYEDRIWKTIRVELEYH